MTFVYLLNMVLQVLSQCHRAILPLKGKKESKFIHLKYIWIIYNVACAHMSGDATVNKTISCCNTCKLFKEKKKEYPNSTVYLTEVEVEVPCKCQEKAPRVDTRRQNTPNKL